MKSLVFVYGTLKRGFSNNAILGNSRLIGDWRTDPVFKMLHLGYFPGVVFPGEDSIKGELFEVNDVIMEKLDVLEGYPTLFDKTMIETPHGPAYMYLYNQIPNRAYTDIRQGVW